MRQFNTATKNKILFTLLLINFTFIQTLDAYNIRRIGNEAGLSNSAILSIHQDTDGFVWFGTVDGLNRYDGSKINLFHINNESEQLSGNLIEDIVETDYNTFWIHTNYGLDKVNKSGIRLGYFPQFQGEYTIRKNKQNDIFIVNEDNSVYYYGNKSNQFVKIEIEQLEFNNIVNFVVTDTDILQFFTRDGSNPKYSIEYTSNNKVVAKLIRNPQASIDNPLQFCFVESNNPNIVYIVDSENKFYEYNIQSHKSYYKYDLSKLIQSNGDISTIIKHHNDYFIGFKTNGLFILTYTPEENRAFKVTDLGVRSGIFSLLNDKFQDIVWIGTDGEGVFIYSNDLYSFKNAEYANLNKRIASPTRAIALDKKKNLWIGTKGDGILKIKNYDNKQDPLLYDIEYIDSNNSNLNDNTIYAFMESKAKNILWIGTEEGLSYYSYADNKIRSVKLETKGEEIKYIHSISETSDSTLWLATVGMGMVKVKFSGEANNIKARETRQMKVMDEKPHHNYFFSIYNQDNRTLWFGNRGYGAYRIDSYTFMISNILLRNDEKNRTLNDIYAITKDEYGSFWFGTSSGLVKRALNGEQKEFGMKDGFPNNVIHGIVHGQKNELWLSTNKGLICFNTQSESFQVYSTNNGLRILEYSDGAFYKDEETSTMFFGGINGFVSFVKSGSSATEYFPHIQLDNITLYGIQKNLSDFISRDAESNATILTLKYNENFFGLSFAAPDYINGNNYVYYYKLGENSMWIDNGLSNKASFTDIKPGEYNLYVKYKNKLTGKEGPTSTTILVITPPWYLSTWAKGFCVILFLTLLYGAFFGVIRRKNKKTRKEVLKLTLQHKEESYESKLQFFTNIAHEFCTPLTLIYGPCNEILSHKEADSFVRKNANIIQRNTEKLNNLIQELIEFRNVDSGVRTPMIERVAINENVSVIANSFADLFSSKHISLSENIEEDVLWNTDPSFLQTIISNLLSNAYLSTPEKGVVQLNIHSENDWLTLVITNTGEGIKKEKLDKIFDRYSMLDALEYQSDKRGASRNRLGLAITNSMVQALGGNIKVESVLNDRTLFKIQLPFMKINKEDITLAEPMRMPISRRIEDEPKLKLPAFEWNPLKKTVLIIDSDVETLVFMSEVFADEYNIIAKESNIEITEVLSERHPDIIISDCVLSSEKDLEAIRKIKTNTATAHIPLILMSTQYSVEEQMKSLDIGAEMFISKPFNTDYIKKSVKHLLSRKNILKDYFNSPISAFDLADNKLIHKENSKFMQEILDIIENNITDPKLSTKYISESLNMSQRHLYRKLRETDSQNPADIIRDTRLHIARNLLVNTQLTVEEIIYKSGFSNKSTFFRQFANKHGVTPQVFREQELNQVEINKENNL